MQMSVGSVSVRDYSAVDGHELHILQRLRPKGDAKEKQEGHLPSGRGDGPTEPQEPLLRLRLDQNPLEYPTDFYVQIGLQPLNVLFCRPFLEAIAAFFVKEKPNALRDLQSVAGAQLEVVRTQAALELQAVLHNRKSVFVRLDVSAPAVYVPEYFVNPDSSGEMPVCVMECV